MTEQPSTGISAARFNALPKAVRYLLAAALFVLAILAAYWTLPDFLGNDWLYSFRPAAEKVLAGENPYTVNQFIIAPWTLLLFIPLTFVPDALAMAVLRVTGLVVYAYVGIKLKAKPLGLVFLLLSPQIMHNLINGNVDWLAFLGFVLPPQIGLFFLIIKPQLGFALGLFWLLEAYRNKTVLRTFAPFAVVLAISFLLFGLWPLQFNTVQAAYNASAWPISLPFGVVLLYVALRQRQERIAQAISPLFSPHVMFHSWASFLFALAPNTIELGLAVAASWFIIALNAYFTFFTL